MTQLQERQNTLLPAERAEHILTRAGGRLGILAGQAMLRFRLAAQAFREEADRMDISESGRQVNWDATVRKNQLTMKRAEALVDQLGQHVGYWAVSGGLQMRLAMARLQEETEDVWVEAQNMRSKWKNEHEQV